MMGLINLGVKRTGERGAGNPHATFDRAGTGNGLTARTKRARSWKRRIRPSQSLRSTAPALDPTGRTFVRVGRFFPSTKRCSTCGHLLEQLSLSAREWTCPECGSAHDRDINAARNLLAEGLRTIALPPGGREVRRVEGAHPRPYAGRPAKRESHELEARS
jgi:hypothetical protein